MDRGLDRLRKTRRRGSTLLFVLIVVLCLGILLVAIVAYSGQTAASTTRLEHEAKVRYIFDGGIAEARYQQETALVDPRWPQLFFVAGSTVNMNLTDLDPDVPLCARLDQSVNIAGRTYTRSDVIGFPALTYDRTLWSFALAVKGPLSFKHYVIANGNVYGSTLTDLSKSTFNRTVKVRASTLPAGLQVKSKRVTYMPEPAWPDARASIYLQHANVVLTGDQVIKDYTFPKGLKTLVYVDGDLTISGKIANFGTFFATGSIHIIDDISNRQRGDRLALIAQKDIVVDQQAVKIDRGFLYAGDTLVLDKPLILLRGAIVASEFDSGAPLVVSADTSIARKRGNTTLYDLKLPGVWP